MSKVAPEGAPPEHNLMKAWKEEGMTMFFIVAMLIGTGFIAYVTLVARVSALAYVGIVGVTTAAMWMPYLMALIYFNTDKGKPMSGLYKKLNYAPLPAPIPKWVKRGMVNHNNSMENFMLFGSSVWFAMSMGVAEPDIRPAAILYFAFRVYYTIFTYAPEIFMMKTAFWCMGWACCTYIFILGLAESQPVYSL